MRLRVVAAVIGALCISACAHLPVIPGAAEEEASSSPREHVRAAIEFLDAGDERQARAELRAALRDQPNNATAALLMEQLDTDPRQLLGANARPYVVRPGETMSQIAERHLGNGLLFYALARYNGMAAPNAVSAGQTLMVPRRTNAAASAPVEVPVTAPAPVQASSSAPNAGPPAANGRANQMRLQGLQHLNAGQVDRAVVLLRQAQALEPANAAIQRDLDRAVRLQASLRARRG